MNATTRRPVLVTGAGGFVGSHTVTALSGRGLAVVGLDHRAGFCEHPGAETLRLCSDFAAREVLDSVARGPFEAVVHQAALVDTTLTDAALLRRENTEKALALAQAANRSGTRFVYASSCSVYGRIPPGTAVSEDGVDASACSGPLNAYAASKLELDRAMARAFGGGDWFWAGLRYTNVFGPGEGHKGAMASMAHQMLERTALGRPIRLFADTMLAARDYVPVSVVAERVAAIVCEGGPSGVYNLGSGVSVSFARLLEWCAELASRTLAVTLVPNPLRERYQYWTGVDMARWAAAFGPAGILGEADIRRSMRALFGHLAPPPVQDEAGRGLDG